MNIRQIIEKCRKFSIAVMMCSIDYAKAFDCVNWNKLLKVLRKIGVPAHTVDLVQSLCEFNSMVVRVDGEESEVFQAKQRLCEGCILVPEVIQHSWWAHNSRCSTTLDWWYYH